MKNSSKVLMWLIIIGALILAVNFYQKNNFNEFVKSIANTGITRFERDNNIKYSKTSSYKMQSQKPNDSIFYQKIKVKKNTPYKVTCMVKTEDVKPEKNISGIGAQISITDTEEKSIAIDGTHDWQKIEMLFNSKNREEVEVGFRLGGYQGNCTGTAWFSDFTIEEGNANDNSKWNFACFIFENTDVTLNGKEIKISMTNSDKTNIKNTLSRFETTARTISKGKMSAKCDIYTVKTPIKKLSYDETYGYYVAAEDVEENIKSTIQSKDYDHIFVVMKLGNEEHENDIEIKDWIGLGYMSYNGIGYANIRLPNSSNSYIYRYNSSINTFPEEVPLHEFLHSLERTSKEYGYEIPALHDNEKYGYKNQRLIGLKNWYADYMNKNIKTSNGYIGLPEEVYKLKPAKSSNFKYSYMRNEFKEPKNIIESIRMFFRNIYYNLKNITSSN